MSSAWGRSGWSGVSGGGSDTTPPAIVYTPASGAVIAKDAAIVIDITDDVALQFFVVTTEFPAVSVHDVVYDGSQFGPAYSALSTIAPIAGGYRLSVRRSGGFPSSPTFHATAVDTSGNDNNADALYTLTATGTVVPVEIETAICTQPKAIAHNPNHNAEALGLFIEQYKDKPRMSALVSSYAAEVQAIEDVCWALIVERGVDVAVDAQLATLGKIVNQPNPGLSDDDYRTLIKARIAVNKSDARARTLKRILYLLAEDGADVQYTEHYPASKVLWLLTDIGAVDPVLVNAMLQQAKGGGVRLNFVYPLSAIATIFRFGTSSDPSAPISSTTQGFGNTEIPANGGKFASVKGSAA